MASHFACQPKERLQRRVLSDIWMALKREAIARNKAGHCQGRLADCKAFVHMVGTPQDKAG